MLNKKIFYVINDINFFFTHRKEIAQEMHSLGFEVNIIGNEIDSLEMSQFEENESINATSVSKGKGFQGTIKVHGFSRGPMTHGSKCHRLPGSIGAGTDPARVFKGAKMGRRKGNERVTLKNLTVVKVHEDNKLIYIKGSVPGNKNTIVLIHK